MQWVPASTSNLGFGSSFSLITWFDIRLNEGLFEEGKGAGVKLLLERESMGSGRPLLQLIFDPAPVFLLLFV